MYYHHKFYIETAFGKIGKQNVCNLTNASNYHYVDVLVSTLTFGRIYKLKREKSSVNIEEDVVLKNLSLLY